ncbi:MAG: bifunctional UDP-N-acetylglucosamine diphosphorylase/glucosamine-1-phosphate N-acetyltransferase GlmU [Anaerococcus sp.]
MIKTIILAAGEGTRMKSSRSKVLHKLLGREILSYVIEASKIEDSETIVIGGKNKKYIEDNYKNVIVKEQKIGEKYPYGTGYAVSLALNEIEDNDTVLVLNGDIPLIRKESIKSFLNYHINENNSCTVLSTLINNPSGYGRIVRDNASNFMKIVEHKDADDKELLINEINTGIYAFKGINLRESIGLIDSNNAQNELYLTDCIKILNENSKKVGAYIAEDSNEFYGINNKKELAIAEKILRKRINDFYMDNGVIIETPEIITIEPGVEIGFDTVISGYVKILGQSKIGSNCIIEGSTRIVDSLIDDNVKIDNSVIEESKVGKNTDIGPFAHLRPKANLGEDIHIGNFVEVKNSSLGQGTKAGHLAYIGDSDLGKNINVGCGVIFVNYDGKFKHRSIVEDGAFIGSNSNIVAPVKVYKEGYIAAGSTITEDVEEGALSIERVEQKNIPGYVEKKKKKDIEIQRSKNDK